LIELFIEDTRARLIATRTRLEEADTVAARGEIHSLIGSCGIYGATRMARLSSALIADIAADSLAAAFITLAELEAEFSRLRSTLRSAAPVNAQVETHSDEARQQRT
jgi:HPt (histidine-containing phosphotransfer) domain-containing protein